MTNSPVPRQIAQTPVTQFNSQSCASLPNYISQDEDDNQAPMRQTTRSAAKSIMQEAMLSCVDIYKPHYIISVDLGVLNYTKTPKLTGTTYTVAPNPKADGTTQTPHEVALRNGKLSDGGRQRTLGVPPPHCKPNHKSHFAALIWKQDWTPCSGNAGAQHRHQHHCLHQEKPGTVEQSKGCDLQPNHLPHQT